MALNDGESGVESGLDLVGGWKQPKGKPGLV